MSVESVAPSIAPPATTGLYVNFGCGVTAPESWINFDASPTPRIERIAPFRWIVRRGKPRVFPANVRYGDIVKGLPIADASCAGVYCSHVLEHLSLNDFETALRNTYRVLRPRGVFRLVMPDLRAITEEYMANVEPDASIRFMKILQIGMIDRPRGASAFVRGWLGNSRHLWMWDEKSVVWMLEKCGFQSIRRAAFGDADDPMFQDVEDASRFQWSVAIQCRR